jgi:hypothetical protein
MPPVPPGADRARQGLEGRGQGPGPHHLHDEEAGAHRRGAGESMNGLMPREGAVQDVLPTGPDIC